MIRKSNRKYKVHVNDVPASYPIGYFPRGFHYQKDAIKAAETAVQRGATFVRVEYPDGAERDFRPVKEKK
jgi:hypothetical protein